jgi:hypothetical protein
MDNTDDLRLLLASRHPLLAVEMSDEARFMDILRGAAEALGLPVWVWTATRGLSRAGMHPAYGTVDPRKALDFIAELADPAVFVFADVHHALQDPVTVRRIKELAQAARRGQTIVLTAPVFRIPPELEGLAIPWDLRPPDRDELRGLVGKTLDDLRARNFPVALDDAAVESLVDALRGLSMAEARGLVNRAAMEDGKVAEGDVNFIRKAKAELLGAEGTLELLDAGPGGLSRLGGMDQLKEWLTLRGTALSPDAKEYGLEPPKGVLLTGVPGCGKSLVAKSLAAAWGLPLVLLDPGSLYGPYVGESEQRLRQALRTVEAMSPVVLWIDEIEKGFARDRDADGGVSARLLGTFLRWMQDRPEGVFLVATCNDVTALPPELGRKGRFDEVFFVDLPDRAERSEIFRVHLQARDRDPSRFDLARLGEAAEGFSGAEIEAAVVAALYRAFAERRELTTHDIVAEIAATVPLSRARPEEVDRLRNWARERAVAA